MDFCGIGNDQEDLSVENEHGDPDENLFSNEDDFPETTTRRQGRRFTPDDLDSESGNEYLNSTTPVESVQDETILVTSEELIPTTEKEALNAKESEKWIEVMEKELQAMLENDVWDQVVEDVPKGARILKLDGCLLNQTTNTKLGW